MQPAYKQTNALKNITLLVVGKSFSCVDITIEHKNITISADIGGNIVYQIV